MDDFLRCLGYKALDSRFKRISDRISHDVRKLYRALDIDVEPHWYLVFMLLEGTEGVSIKHIATQLGYAHPTTVILVKKMADKGYLLISNNNTDRRKQMVSLSEMAIDKMPSLKLLWNSCEKAILQLLGKEQTVLMNSLDQMDKAMKETTFHDRFKEIYLNNIKS